MDSQINLSIGGMTCAACSARLERVLGKMEGVREVAVNLALERAAVRCDLDQVELAQISERVAAAGFSAQVLKSPGVQSNEDRVRREQEMVHQRSTLIFSAALSLPLVAGMVVHLLGIQLPVLAILDNGLLQWALATPVQFVAGWQFYRDAYRSLRGGGANMSVLVALGTSAAYLYSTIAALAGRAEFYFETSALLITLILLGKLLEARAKMVWRIKAYRKSTADTYKGA